MKPETAKSSHTPTPWKHDSKFPTSIWDGSGQGERWLASTNVDTINPFEEREANAKFIVRAVNSHADLLEALKPITQIMKLQRMFEPDELKRKAWDEPIAVAEAAILAAEGTK